MNRILNIIKDINFTKKRILIPLMVLFILSSGLAIYYYITSQYVYYCIDNYSKFKKLMKKDIWLN